MGSKKWVDSSHRCDKQPYFKFSLVDYTATKAFNALLISICWTLQSYKVLQAADIGQSHQKKKPPELIFWWACVISIWFSKSSGLFACLESVAAIMITMLTLLVSATEGNFFPKRKCWNGIICSFCKCYLQGLIWWPIACYRWTCLNRFCYRDAVGLTEWINRNNRRIVSSDFIAESTTTVVRKCRLWRIKRVWSIYSILEI